MTKKEISKDINADIEMGVYENYPGAKKRMQYLAHKLMLCHYCPSKEMSRGEISTLEENDYYLDD